MLAGCQQADLPSYGVVPDFVLTSETGEEFASKAALDGNVWVANFIFTTCHGPCPRMSSQMRHVQEAVKGSQGVRLVSFTIDPANDTPPVLADYARRYKAEPGLWHFLTGPQETLHSLKRNAFMLGSVDGSLEHSTRFVLVDKKSRIRGFYATDEAESIPKLIADIRALAKESF